MVTIGKKISFQCQVGYLLDFNKETKECTVEMLGSFTDNGCYYPAGKYRIDNLLDELERLEIENKSW